jgi:flavin-binding protein dodecin
MSIVKVIELLAQSPVSWEDAAQKAIHEAAKTVHQIGLHQRPQCCR